MIQSNYILSVVCFAIRVVLAMHVIKFPDAVRVLELWCTYFLWVYLIVGQNVLQELEFVGIFYYDSMLLQN